MLQLSSAHRRYILIERVVGTVINLVMGLGSSLLAVSVSPLPVWGGSTSVAFDLVITSLFAPFMTMLFVTLLTRRRVASGVISRIDGAPRGLLTLLPHNVLLRALVFAIACAAILVPLGFAALASLGVQALPAIVFFVGKAIFILLVVIAITRSIVLAALCSRPL